MKLSSILDERVTSGWRAAVVGGVLLITAPAAFAAADRTWGDGSNGPLTAGSMNWNTLGNWTGDDVPDTTIISCLSFRFSSSSKRSRRSSDTPSPANFFFHR